MKKYLKQIAARLIVLLPTFICPQLKMRAHFKLRNISDVVRILENNKVCDLGRVPIFDCLNELQEYEKIFTLYKKHAYLAADEHNTHLFAQSCLFLDKANDGLQALRNYLRKNTGSPGMIAFAARYEFAVGNQGEAIKLLQSIFFNNLGMAKQIAILVMMYAPRHPFLETIFETVLTSDIEADDKLNILIDTPLLEISDGDSLEWRHILEKNCQLIVNKDLKFNNPGRCDSGISLWALHEYCNYNDLSLRKKIVECVYKRFPGLVADSEDFQKVEVYDKIKIGLALSRFDDPNFETLIFDSFSSFDHHRYEFHLYVPNNVVDNLHSQRVKKLALRTYNYNTSDWNALRAHVKKSSVEILLHENTTSAAVKYLALARLSPLQCNFLDRCSTIGAPHEDYTILFGNSNQLERFLPTQNDKLAILKNCYVMLPNSRISPEPVTHQSLGVPEDALIFFYPSIHTRLNAGFDLIIRELLLRNPKAYFFAVAWFGEESYWLKLRWAKHMPECVNRTRLLKYPVPFQQFAGLLQRADLVLSPFCSAQGAITLSTIFQTGKATVAGTGDYFNSSIAEIFYDKMGVEGLIANSEEHYVDIAMKLLHDTDWRKEQEAKISSNLHKLYNPKEASRELQNFVSDACLRNRQGLPPAHWVHGKFEA